MKIEAKTWLFLIVMGWIAVLTPQRITGWIFPAVENTVIERTEITETGVAFWGSSFRPRPNCSFSNLEWFLGKRGGQKVPLIVVLGPPKLRPGGKFDFGPWFVNMSNENIFRSGTHADAIHTCRIFADYNNEGGVEIPWKTRTSFWN